MDVARALLDDAEQYNQKVREATVEASAHATRAEDIAREFTDTASAFREGREALATQLKETNKALVTHAKYSSSLPKVIHDVAAAKSNPEAAQLKQIENDFEEELDEALAEAHGAIEEAEADEAKSERDQIEKERQAQRMRTAVDKLKEVRNFPFLSSAFLFWRQRTSPNPSPNLPTGDYHENGGGNKIAHSNDPGDDFRGGAGGGRVRNDQGSQIGSRRN